MWIASIPNILVWAMIKSNRMIISKIKKYLLWIIRYDKNKLPIIWISFIWLIWTLCSIDLSEWYCQYQGIDSDTENYWSVWRLKHYDITWKRVSSVFKVSTCIISSIRFRLIRLAAVPVIMSVWTFKTAIILYV
jgi:hypothetical protein